MKIGTAKRARRSLESGLELTDVEASTEISQKLFATRNISLAQHIRRAIVGCAFAISVSAFHLFAYFVFLPFLFVAFAFFFSRSCSLEG